MPWRWNGVNRNGHATAPTVHEKFSNETAAALLPGFNSATSRLQAGMVKPKPKP